MLFDGRGRKGLSHVFVQHRGSQPGPGTKLNGRAAEVFLKDWRREFVRPGLQQRQSSSVAPPPQRWSASAVLWAQQTDEDLWDLSQLLLGKLDACDFIALYTFSINLLLYPAFLKANLSE